MSLIKCQICESDGKVNHSASQMNGECMVQCVNDDCRNSKMLVRLYDWQSIPIKDHPLKDEIISLIKSGKLVIS